MSEFWSSQTFFGLTRHQFGGVIILSLVVLVGLMSAKLRYPAVFFVKLIRIPLDLISFPFRLVYMVSGIVGSLTGAIKPVEGIVYLNGAPGSQGGGAGAGVRRDIGKISVIDMFPELPIPPGAVREKRDRGMVLPIWVRNTISNAQQTPAAQTDMNTRRQNKAVPSFTPGITVPTVRRERRWSPIIWMRE